MKFLTEFSVKNSLLVNLLNVALIVFGITALSKLNREAFPNINFDIVQITSVYPSATPLEVEKLITIPIEKELKTVDDIDEITSVSTEGLSLISIQLNENTKNKFQVIQDIQRATDNAKDLPIDMPQKPVVRELKTKDTPVIEMSLSGDVDEATLRLWALALEKKVLDLPDVSSVSRRGLRDREIWIELTPERLKEHHVSFNELALAVQKQNVTWPGGKFYIDHKEFLLKTSGQFSDKNDVAQTVIRSGTLGEDVKVGEVALVKDAFAEETTINKSRAKRAIVLTVIKKEKGDAIHLVRDLKELAKNFQKDKPELKVDYINDFSYYIQRRLNVLINNGVAGLIMVGLCLFTFLSSGAAVSACLGIPTVLLTTFATMYYLDISINLLSLFGLIMVLGMLVDEDIVMAENMHRHIENNNEDIESATIKGANEVSLPVISTVLTTIVVFIPIFYMGGIMGKFSRHIPMVIIIALMASLLEALVILPTHVSHFTQLSHRFKNRFRFQVPSKLKNILEWPNLFLDKSLLSYQRFLIFAILHRYKFLLALVLLFAGSMGLVTKNIKKFQLFPSEGVEIFFVRAKAPVGTSLDEMSDKMQALENLIETKLKTEELDTYTTQVGLQRNDPNDPNTQRGNHLAQITVYLTPEDNRERRTKAIMNDLREAAKGLTGFDTFSFDEVRNGPPSGRPLEIRIRGDDFATLDKLSRLYAQKLETIDGIYDIRDDYELDKDELHIQVDSVKAAQMGLSVNGVALAVRQAFEGLEATQITTSEEEIAVILKFDPRLRNNLEALNELLIPNSTNQLVALKHVAEFKKTKTLQNILHFKNSRNVNVTANIDNNKVGILEVQDKLISEMQNELSAYPGYEVEFGGEGKRTLESLDNLKQAMLASVLLIMVILIGMFGSLILPIINALIIPFTLIGVIVAFELHQKNLSFMALLGLVALTGIVVDAGTIMIEFIRRFQKEGLPLEEAIPLGAVLRFRAVILITLTTVLGLLPSAYGLGGNDPFISPMAMALNYGMIFSTVLTLIYVPLFMLYLEDTKNALMRLFKGKVQTDKMAPPLS